MKEVWKDVNNYEGYYQISNKGRIRSLDREIEYSNGRVHKYKGKILKQRDCKGYLATHLAKNNKQKFCKIHRLVAEAFIPNELDKPQVNHKDGDKHNNNVNNLEWVTMSENMTHAYKNGLNKGAIGEKAHGSKLNKNDVIEIKKLLKYTDKTQREIAKNYDVKQTQISRIKLGKRWGHISLEGGD